MVKIPLIRVVELILIKGKRASNKDHPIILDYNTSRILNKTTFKYVLEGRTIY